MIFQITNDKEEWGYVCESEDDASFLFCLSETENQIELLFTKAIGDKHVSYLVEQRNGRDVGWDVKVIDRAPFDIVSTDTLYLVNKKELNCEA